MVYAVHEEEYGKDAANEFENVENGFGDPSFMSHGTTFVVGEDDGGDDVDDDEVADDESHGVFCIRSLMDG